MCRFHQSTSIDSTWLPPAQQREVDYLIFFGLCSFYNVLSQLVIICFQSCFAYNIWRRSAPLADAAFCAGVRPAVIHTVPPPQPSTVSVPAVIRDHTVAILQLAAISRTHCHEESFISITFIEHMNLGFQKRSSNTKKQWL